MNIIDDKGRLFGTVNIIDALAVLLILAIVAAGTALVLGADSPGQVSTDDQPMNTTTTVTFKITNIQSYVAAAIPEGPIDTERIAIVQNKSVRPTEVIVTDQNGTLHERQHPRKQTVTLSISLNTTMTKEDIMFGNESLEVGRQFTLDFGQVTVEGTVTSIVNKS